MGKNAFDDFAKTIAPFRPLWRSVHLVVFAVRKDDVWLNLATRATLGDSFPRSGILDVNPRPDFLVFGCDLPESGLGLFLDNAVQEGYIDLGKRSPLVRVFLAAPRSDQTARIDWSGPNRIEARWALERFGFEYTCHLLTSSGGGQRFYELLPYVSISEIDSALRISEPPFENAKALVAQVAPNLVDFQSASDSPRVEFVAPMPFSIDYNPPGDITVEGPGQISDDDLSLHVFFPPLSQTVNPTLTAANPVDGAARRQWKAHLMWPQGARTANSYLYFRSLGVTNFEFARWPLATDIRQATDLFFDSGHSGLRKALFGERKGGSDAFEQAVVRLFQLLDLPAIWYGRNSAEARPDAAAVFAGTASDRPIVLLIEVTTGKVRQKFTPLKDRGTQLQQRLEEEAEILPVLVSCADVSVADITDAAHDGIVLLGRSQLQALLEMIAQTTNSREVITYLKTALSIRQQENDDPWQ